MVAGQGTLGLEILEQCPDVRTILVGVGGGGLIAGIAAAVKAVRPDVRVVGVQAERAAAFPPSLAAGRPVMVEPAATMADQVPKEVVQDRYDRLIALQERISLEENQKVQFDVTQGPKGPQAANITAI